MVAFRRHEAWDHTASVIAAVYQSSCAEEGKVFWPEAHHPGYVPLEGSKDTGTQGNRVLPKDAVPQKMVFGMLKSTFIKDSKP